MPEQLTPFKPPPTTSAFKRYAEVCPTAQNQHQGHSFKDRGQPRSTLQRSASVAISTMSAGDDINQHNMAATAGDSLQQHTYNSHDASQLQHGSYSQQPQQQEQDSQGHSQPDALTQQLHHVLVGEITRFWSSTVEPSAQSIFQVSSPPARASTNNCALQQLEGRTLCVTRQPTTVNV